MTPKTIDATRAVEHEVTKPNTVLKLEVSDGYGIVQHEHEDEVKCASIHRLNAVAWFGISYDDSVVVHHDNEDTFDNTEENLKVLTRSEHLFEHSTNRHYQPSDEYIEEHFL